LTFDVFPVWEKVENAITFAYGVHFRKTIYEWNQHNKPYAMELVSFDYENLKNKIIPRSILDHGAKSLV
jgi:hypothetical protein